MPQLNTAQGTSTRIDTPLQPARCNTGRVLIILTMQSPPCKWRIDSTQFCHQRSQTMNHLLGVTGVFDGYGEDPVSHFAAASSYSLLSCR